MINNDNAMMIKTKAVFGQRLKAGNYQTLLQKKTVSEIASYLKNETYFKNILEGINEKSIHRGQLETLIRVDLFNRYSKLMRYAFDKKDDFYRFIIIECEITQILNTVKSFMLKDKTLLISSMPIFVENVTSFNFKELANVHDFDELLKILNNTPYYGIVNEFKKHNLKDLDYAGLEHSLKKLYYTEILRLANKNFNNEILANIKDMLLTQIELENLNKIYRLKKYFNATPKQIKYFITPIYQYFTKNSLYSLIDNCDSDKLLKKMKESKYGYYMGDIKHDKFEYYVKRINYEISKKYMYFSNNADVILFSYMMLAETEIQNIIDIIEGARYKIGMEKISRLLIY